jgi:DNA-binding transcriptional LysR family regulator
MDLGFRREPAVNPILQSICLYAETFALVVPANRYLTEENFKGFQELADEKFIISGLHHSTLYVASLHSIFNAYNFTPNVYIESDFGATILSLVAKGLGLSILPSSYSFSAQPGIRFIPLPHKASLYVTWRKEDTNSVLRNVLDVAAEVSTTFK